MATSTSNFVFLKGHNDFLFTIARAAEKNYPDNTPSRNWHLDWQNLLGCCHGGSQRNVVDASQRFTSLESSCDVPKDGKNLDSAILNPLQITAFPKLFSYDRSTGAFFVDSDACQQAGINEAVAQNTIDELNLDAERLKRFRKVTLNNLNAQMTSLVREGLSIWETRENLQSL
ncbi:retron system putative HNH endonuclease [Idiomarina abyssalis]|uniref:retron system putative HNH endonuclease n=1 Tax=Idiomarina abyssalis TaxID=86102 RepID=UPI003A8DF6F1